MIGDKEVSNTSLEHFLPPYVAPPTSGPATLFRLFRAFRNQIEGWPKAIYTDELYRPPIPKAPFFIMNSQAIKTVLLDDAPNYTHGEVFKRIMRPVWGKGLLPSEGKAWRWQRGASTHAFRPADMTGLAPQIRSE